MSDATTVLQGQLNSILSQEEAATSSSHRKLAEGDFSGADAEIARAGDLRAQVSKIRAQMKDVQAQELKDAEKSEEKDAAEEKKTPVKEKTPELKEEAPKPEIAIAKTERDANKLGKI